MILSTNFEFMFYFVWHNAHYRGCYFLFNWGENAIDLQECPLPAEQFPSKSMWFEVWRELVCFPWLLWDLMDDSCELSLLTEILSVRELWQTSFYWTLWVQIPSAQSKRRHTNRQTDREEWRNNKIYIHPPGNEPFNCVSHPSFS